MQANQTPTLVPLAFAAGGAFNAIPEASQIGTNPGGASLVDGFPPLTRTPIAAGGIPPSGLDMNGVLNLITQSTRWAHGGGRYAFNSAFAADTNVGGYPAGAMLMSADGFGTWLSLVDNNSDNPDTGPGTKWAPSQAYGFSAISGLTNVNVTLTPAQAMKSRIVLTGALTGNVQIILPAWTREWTIVNNTTGAFSITAKTASGTGVVIPAGPTRVVGDGTNITQPAENIASATLSTQPVTAGQIGAIGSQGSLPINTSAKINGVNSANLLVNGSGELGSSNWSFAANFATQNDVTGGIGGFFGNTAALSGASGSNFTGNMAVGANVPLTLSFDAASNVSAGTYSVALVAYNSSGTFIGNVAAVTIPNGASTSTRYSAGGTTPAGTAYVTSSFNITGVTAPVNGVVWRRVKVEQANAPSLYSQEASIAAVGGGMPVIGSARNFAMSVAVASATAPATADEIIVESALGGVAYKLANFNKTINLATTGAGGMDTGSAPVSGYVALYAIYNPTTGASALLARNATSAVQPNVYGGANMPSGYTASALVSVWPTNGSGQFIVGAQVDRAISIPSVTVLTTSTTQASPTALSISGAVPPNARKVSGTMSVSSTSSTPNSSIIVYAASTGVGIQGLNNSVSASGGISTNYKDLPITVSQTLYYTATSSAGTPTFTMGVASYEF
ncbi:Tail fiber protein [Burkholderia pseudomallei]|uniref:hypothetical protein n=1 Tax=Burkholderia pseudomallei TaxID=28450 RepID=UPI0005E7BE4C|nr:hypothetical protein [Burkholderia pseudomallei]CAJ9922175.1 Tail fiber protein [Burkholderia pseudomallei]CAK1308040.1 Tail fiber protein [Burkholderia pseudomallei]CPG53201.1 Tail fiber protein [Burkholderia pseudomallei]